MKPKLTVELYFESFHLFFVKYDTKVDLVSVFLVKSRLQEQSELIF